MERFQERMRRRRLVEIVHKFSIIGESMKLIIVNKGGKGSGDFGHRGIPGHQGGSGPGGANPYKGKSFRDASNAIMQDAIAGVVRGPWTLSAATANSASLELPEGGKATIQVTSEHYVTGKYVAGTTSQQRYKVGLTITTYTPSKETGPRARPFSRWDQNWLYTKKVKPDGLAEATATAQKKFQRLFERMYNNG